MNILVMAMLMVSMVGCSTMRESLIVGAGTGAATGAIGASSFADRNKGQAALQGALIGGAIGGIASYFVSGILTRLPVPIFNVIMV